MSDLILEIGDHEDEFTGMVTHKDCILIGTDLISEEDGEIVFGNNEHNIRIKADGRIIHDGKEVPLDETLVKNLEYVVRKLVTQIQQNGN